MGEYTVGASYAMRAIKNIEEGYPISMVIPAEGSGNETKGESGISADDWRESGVDRRLG